MIARSASTTAAFVLAGALLTGCAGEAAPANDTGDGRLALLSGRDDHGLVALDQVPVYADASGAHAVGKVHDGTLVRVIQRDGMWMRVTALEGPAVTGWVDDFYLRGQLRMVGAAPSCAALVGDTEVPGGQIVVARTVRDGRVLVETADGDGEPTGTQGWARRADLQELPPQGPKCGEDPLGSKHRH